MRISDWSSDVCSSDLQSGVEFESLEHGLARQEAAAATNDSQKHSLGRQPSMHGFDCRQGQQLDSFAEHTWLASTHDNPLLAKLALPSCDSFITGPPLPMLGELYRETSRQEESEGGEV